LHRRRKKRAAPFLSHTKIPGSLVLRRRTEESRNERKKKGIRGIGSKIINIGFNNLKLG
jgi:hypothetical protein